MTQNAIVKKTFDDNTAQVAVQRESACGGNCAACGGCKSMNIIIARAKNTVHAVQGDKVTIQSSTPRILSAAAMVYLVPLLTFFLGYFIGAALELSEKLSIAASLVGLFAGSIAVVFFQRSRGKNSVSFEIISVDG